MQSIPRPMIWTPLLAALTLTVMILGPTSAVQAQHADHHSGAHDRAHDGAHLGAHADHADHESGEDPHAHHREMLAKRVKLEKASDLKIPDVPVVTQDGDEVDFYSDLVEDKVVVMNFVFTTCTTICPPLGANFGKLQQILGDKAGSEVHLISVSVDPVTDTPERLKAWGEIFGAGPGWTLVTGSKTEVTRLLKSLQVFTPDFTDHSPVLLMGNEAAGEWTRAYGLAPPEDLAAMLEGMAGDSHHTAQAQVKGGSR